ncbi:BAK_1a_G0019310.mRNA.1.CDS.1 [Saccharomyces cerevisiae]|nr:BAK_1a_G0019310.mRNA.1.CDS.1 [Saccharomyces cerevisiae]CAI7118094.1 BAK_1a_G0019310.mRNA.1.CDS.1 [Saccharomyces cerevisiae]
MVLSNVKIFRLKSHRAFRIGPMIKAVAGNLLVKRFYQPKLERIPPASLLLKQKIRLAQNGSTTSTENPISFSQTMSEIFSVLQPSAPDLDEDKTSGLKRDHLLTERLNNGELGVIMNKFFNPSSTHNNQLIDTNILLQNFPKLSGNDLDLLDFAINEKMRGNWNDLKQDFIQLWYYKSFGFLGPRTQFVLTNSSPSLRSQFLKLPFTEYNWFLLQNNKNANILPADVQNVVKVFHLDDKRFTWRSIDPFSKAIISFVVFVSIYVWLDKSAKQKTKELPAQKSTVISE